MSQNSNPPPEKKAEPNVPFERCLQELESIVAQLESGSRPLEESLALYERGVTALKHCHVILDKAEKRIRMLVRGADGEPQVREAEVVAQRSPSSRRARQPRAGTVQHEENADDDAQGGRTAGGPPASELSKGQNSSQQRIDSAPASGQNPADSVTPKTDGQPGSPGKPKPADQERREAGGSLFGNAQ
jgi:exodeoxyribonuclease VII small subunit